MENRIHKPVLLKETLEYLDVQAGDVVVDATFGFGGHSLEIQKKLKMGRIIGIEKDSEVIKLVKSEIPLDKVTVVHDDFRHISQVLKDQKIKSVDKILFDLGVSSFHFDTSGRGFTFQKDEPLDMRLNIGFGATAADLVNGLSQSELADMFYTLSDERMSRQIAKAIVEARRQNKFEKTGELVSVIRSVKRPEGKVHPATKVFQALRIAVNDELGAIEEVLPNALGLLNKNGRIAVISFHSGEDRIVKNIFKQLAKEEKVEILTKKPIVAQDEERKDNPRSRSAKLRVAKRRN